ncbi:MAG: calcium-binding protein [Hyphomicrobium sp.]
MTEAYSSWDGILSYDSPPLVATSTRHFSLNSDGTETRIFGTGFVYDSEGTPTGGTITRIDRVDVSGSPAVILERLTGLTQTLGQLADFLQPTLDKRETISWLPELAAVDDVAFANATRVRLALVDGTFLEFVGSGLSTALNTPGLAGGTVTQVRHLDASLQVIGTERANFPSSTLQFAVGVFLDDFFSEVAFRNLFTGGGITYTAINREVGYDPGFILISMHGGPGNDHFIGHSDNGSSLDYSSSASAVTVNFQTRTVTGDGNDTFASINHASGSAFNDSIIGNSVRNVIQGDVGNDTLSGNGGDDLIDGGGGNDTISGGAGNDTAAYNNLEPGGDGGTAVTVDLRITGFQNTGTQGMDRLSSIENLFGSSEGDTLTGSNGGNLINGFGGNDNISGLNGDDELIGGDGNDTINGGAGSDSLFGGAGRDILIGGTDEDFFVYNTAIGAANADSIRDFGSNDFIGFDVSIFTRLTYTGPGDGEDHQILANEFTTFAAGIGADDHILYDEATGQLFYDVNGSGAGGRTLIATIGTTSHPTLTAADILVYTDAIL